MGWGMGGGRGAATPVCLSYPNTPRRAWGAGRGSAASVTVSSEPDPPSPSRGANARSAWEAVALRGGCCSGRLWPELYLISLLLLPGFILLRPRSPE